MGYTFAEKALARGAGLAEARAGQVFDVEPDVILSHDNTAAIAKIFRRIGVERVKYPERLAITLDHAVPASTTLHAENHAAIRRFVAEQGITHFFEAGRGICHQVLCEEGLVGPGRIVLGADSHTTHYGALGAFGAGIGRTEVAALWATGALWMRVPESIKITVVGRLGEWTTSKDLALHIIGALGADAGTYASVEFHGEGIAALSMESRFVLSNMMAEMGVKNAWVQPDDVTLDWLAGTPSNLAAFDFSPPCKGEMDNAERRTEGVLADLAAVTPDEDAAYSAEYTFDAGGIEPQVARPHTVDNVVPLSAIAGTRVQQAFVGTCTNGRLEDIAAAAGVLAGRHVAPGARLIVIPASSEVLRAAMARGYIAALVDAGAMIGTPGCGPCMGNHFGVPAPEEVTISTANRNFNGRMGTPGAPVYLASPAVVAASAAAGRIVHPAEIAGEREVL
jgi:3-isopropylmalate/(R)-2-methylmalate dehydratase large subunit